MGDTVAVLAHLRIVRGYPDQTLALHRPIGRWELAVLCERFLRWVDQELAVLDASHKDARPGAGEGIGGPAGNRVPS
jgi:hypothetical protein